MAESQVPPSVDVDGLVAAERRTLEGGEIVQPEPEQSPAMKQAMDELRRARDRLVTTLEQQGEVAHREGPSFTVDRDHSWIEAAGFQTVRHSPPVGSIAVGAPGAGFGLIVPDEETGRYGVAEVYGPDLHLVSEQHPALHVEGADPISASSRALPSLDDLIGAEGTPEALPMAPKPSERPEEAIPGEVYPGRLDLDPVPNTIGDHVITRYILLAWCEVHQDWHPAATR